jgi:hypothetical protein
LRDTKVPVRLGLFSLILFTVLAGCSEARRGGGGAIIQNDDAAMNPLDANTNADAAPEADSGMIGDDTGIIENDSGMTPIEDSGTPVDDSGTPPFDGGIEDDAGEITDSGLMDACADLLACCSAVPPQLQAQCISTANAGDIQQCMMVLSIAQQLGVCMGAPVTDAGARDVGPLGPSCTAYLACCPSLGPLQMNCESSAMSGDEAICAQSLSGLQQAGFCGGDASIPIFDASFPDI